MQELHRTNRRPTLRILGPCLFVFLGSLNPVFGQSDRVVANLQLRVFPSQCTVEIEVLYKDVLAQLALQPGANIDSPTSEEFRRALETVIDQRLILHAARAEAPYFEWASTDEDIRRTILEVFTVFSTPAEVERRIKLVGFKSLDDGEFRRLVADRWLIGKYIEERFRRGNQSTEAQERICYEQKFIPEFRRNKPGLLIPSLDEVRTQIQAIITESRVNIALDRYLEMKRRASKITVHVNSI